MIGKLVIAVVRVVLVLGLQDYAKGYTTNTALGSLVSSRRATKRMGWSRVSWIVCDPTNYTDFSVQVSECYNEESAVCETPKRAFDLTSPREWLEYMPNGAYTVLRCDMVHNKKHNKEEWKIWGLRFHLDRLRRSLLEGCRKGLITCPNLSQCDLDRLEMHTRKIIDTMLMEAHPLSSRICSPTEEKALMSVFGTCMLTILWFGDPKQKMVEAQGHILRLSPILSGSNMISFPSPISAALAMTTDRTIQSSLPNRMANPTLKLSGWCSERRPLEDLFKSSKVGEVFLLSTEWTQSSELHSERILEGLTSNIFVLYPNNTLRTASSGVLDGFARELVLQSAVRLGLNIDLSKPILLSESSLWQEVFLTSAIKLVVPVDKVMAITETNNAVNDSLWSYERPVGSVADTLSKVSQLLYHDILAHHFDGTTN